MELLKKLVGLETRVWAASFLNIAAMASQLWTMLSTKSTDGVSRAMLLIFILVQLTFAQVGYKTGVWAQYWGMFLSALITATILVGTFIY